MDKPVPPYFISFTHSDTVKFKLNNCKFRQYKLIHTQFVYMFQSAVK